jgi:hypothetical protein
MIQLGVKAKDKITGFTGIVIGHVQYLTGCDQYGLCPAVGKDGKTADTQYFDESRIEVIGKGVSITKPVSKKDAGGPNRDQP